MLKPREFKVGDRVTWKSQAAGSWKRKTGTITEVVPPNKLPQTQHYYGRRPHQWYVVSVDGVMYYPVASKLAKARS